MALTKAGSKSAKKQPEASRQAITGMVRRKITEARIIKAAIPIFAEKGPDSPVIDDFIKAAKVARGTFYNYFNNTDELLRAASVWLAEDLILSIEQELKPIRNPALRHGVGVRLWMAKAMQDQAWCGFVATIWLSRIDIVQAPFRNIRLGMKAGEFSSPSIESGYDLALGTIRQGMLRILRDTGRVPTNYPDQIAVNIMQGLNASPSMIDQVLAYPLPELRRPAASMK